MFQSSNLATPKSGRAEFYMLKGTKLAAAASSARPQRPDCIPNSSCWECDTYLFKTHLPKMLQLKSTFSVASEFMTLLCTFMHHSLPQLSRFVGHWGARCWWQHHHPRLWRILWVSCCNPCCTCRLRGRPPKERGVLYFRHVCHDWHRLFVGALA